MTTSSIPWPRGTSVVAAGTVAGLLMLFAAAPAANAEPTGGDAASPPEGDEGHDHADDDAPPNGNVSGPGDDGDDADGADDGPPEPGREDDSTDATEQGTDGRDRDAEGGHEEPTSPDEAPTDVPVVDGEPIDFRRTAANSPGNRILRRIAWIAQGGQDHRYRHRTKIRRAQGLYWWDCSGMASWLLEKEAPVALRGLFAERPTAERFHDTIVDAPTDESRRGWQRIPRIQDVMPGDVFAWRLPPDQESVNTGHVGFVLRPPVALPDVGEGAWAIRIADSTSTPHENDVRVEGRRTGFGFGTILIVVDDDGAPIAYGWRGAQSAEVVETDIVFGRVTR